MTETSAQIRIALVITELHVGGAERCCAELAKGLAASNYAVMVYSLRPAPPEEQSSLVEELRSAGIPVRFLNARSWLSLPRTLLSLWRHLRRQRPGVVQAFLFHASFLSAIIARLAKVPRVFTGIRVAEPRRWQLAFARLTDRLVTRHVCVSQAVADFSSTVGRLPADKLVVIANGVDLERFTHTSPADLREFGVSEGRRAITFIGRLDAQKGLGWLLHLASRIFARFMNHDLLIVGHGPQRELLERVVHDLQIQKWVRFAGWQADVPAILAASDVLVLPSQWEGMPNVVLEAMAAAKPIVACDVEGVRELLGPLSQQQAVPPGDADAFLERLAAILEDARLGVELGSQNRVRAASQFSLMTMIAKYDRLYRETVPEAR